MFHISILVAAYPENLEMIPTNHVPYDFSVIRGSFTFSKPSGVAAWWCRLTWTEIYIKISFELFI